MPKCKIKDCKKYTPYKNSINPYCHMHMARIRRHGYPELKKDAYQSLEKLPHKIVDTIIKKYCKNLIDEDIVKKLRGIGFNGATVWTVGYRRRKLGSRKYLRGKIQKHKAWIRAQAIKKYGTKCELCDYNMAIDTHHIIPKYQGGPHEIDNLMVICPNCHALITRNVITIRSRKEISKVRRRVLKSLNKFYTF